MKGPSISLFKIKDGDCIGGYTKAQWESVDGGKIIGDSDAMLFNLSRQLHFTNTGKGEEVWCRSQYGPFYGYDELSAYEPFNGDGNCTSCANRDNYKIKEEGGKNMLTNENTGKFTITELEVWSIKEVVRNNMI